MTKRIGFLLVLFALAFSAPPAHAGSKAVPDNLIYDNVRRKLATDDTVKGGGLDLDVKDGNVILRGVVDSPKKKEKAEKIAKRVNGVKSVDNEIVVKVVEK
jgi:hyperosmotically inducible protein